jgi:hypothetical protein
VLGYFEAEYLTKMNKKVVGKLRATDVDAALVEARGNADGLSKKVEPNHRPLTVSAIYHNLGSYKRQVWAQ